MSVPFVGQIQPLAFSFAPRGWATCDGQLLPISQNTALFSLLGTNYGGDGRTTFALPNLQSRVPLHYGTSRSNEHFSLGEKGGVETVTLTSAQLPAHNHSFSGSSADSTAAIPAEGVALAKATHGTTQANDFYGAPSPPQTLNPDSIGQAGDTGAHDNLQPYLTLNWCIALMGIYPSRN